ncbi:acyl-CoA synthetase [Gilvimarinus sp. F26214L]|uniref:acyl-CoA synthetase n=1 Tax=Gilvimarinus sp. DZF01 TaxID=3461371 RepID=UPI00404591E1
MENAYVPHAQAPLINTLHDVEVYESEQSLDERYPLQTSYQVLEAAAANYGEDLALRFLLTGERDEAPLDLSFRQVFERVTQTANALHELGVRAGDAVAIMLPSTLHSHYVTWGCQVAGISSPINPLLEPEHIIQIMRTTGARVLITTAPLRHDPQFWPKLQRITGALPGLETLMLVNVEGYTEPAEPFDGPLQVLDFDTSVAAQPHDRLLTARRIQGEEVASYFHTGGTTGHPKIAQVTHRNIAVVSQMIEHLVRANGRLVSMSALPMFHIYGLIAAGIATLYAGRTIVIMTPEGFRNPNVLENWWHHAGRFGVKAFASVPTILAALMQVPTGDADLSALEDVGSGASPLPKQLRRDFEARYGVRVTNGYGMTETTCIMTRQRAESPGPEGSVGTRFPYTEVRTVMLEGTHIVRDCEPNESGVLIVRGPHVFKGYLNPEDNAEAWADGDWFITGDLAFMDADGFVTLTGRAKDLIIRGGHNIDPALIEEPLAKHPAVAQVVAVGQPDLYAGELPVAYVQLKPQFRGKVDESELLAHCEQSIQEAAAVPKRIELIDEMPLTAVGKIFKPELRNRAINSVLSECLQQQGIEAVVESRYEKSRGHIARVRLADPAREPQARTELENFPLTVEFA